LENKNQVQLAEIERQKAVLAVEQAARRQALSTLQAKLALLDADLNNNAKDLSERTSALTAQTQAAKVAEDSLAAITAEVNKLRNEIRLAQQERDETYLKTVALTDKLNQAEALRERLDEQNSQLQDQYAELNRVAQAMGFDARTLVSQIPPKLDGKVTAVNEAQGLVEISLGSDDGLKRGHVLQVISGNTYLGQIKLREVGPDKSVGDVDKKMQRGRIQKGDNVTTKLS
jgi:chromosome segregation ATPase